MEQQQFDFHPLADLFPVMNDESYKTLVADIKERGLRHPIILAPDESDEGKQKILDGRNRYRACLEAGVLPHFDDLRNGSAIDYVVSVNLIRRHLSTSQRAALAAKIEAAKAAEIKAQERIRKTKAKSEEPTEEQPEETSEVPRSAAKEAAQAVGVSTTYVSAAKQIGKKSPKTLKEIQRGEKTIAQAKRELGLDKPKRTRKEAASDVTDDEWLLGLPLSSKLEGVPLKTFQEDAAAYRTASKAVLTFQESITDVLDNAKRKGAYVTRLKQLVNTSPPEKWKFCPEGDDGCNGGMVKFDDGQCVNCHGRGYTIK
jgi:ParB-like chromosome segregation protein Spo0J